LYFLQQITPFGSFGSFAQFVKKEDDANCTIKLVLIDEQVSIQLIAIKLIHKDEYIKCLKPDHQHENTSSITTTDAWNKCPIFMDKK